MDLNEFDVSFPFIDTIFLLRSHMNKKSGCCHNYSSFPLLLLYSSIIETLFSSQLIKSWAIFPILHPEALARTWTRAARKRLIREEVAAVKAAGTFGLFHWLIADDVKGAFFIFQEYLCVLNMYQHVWMMGMVGIDEFNGYGNVACICT